MRILLYIYSGIDDKCVWWNPITLIENRASGCANDWEEIQIGITRQMTECDADDNAANTKFSQNRASYRGFFNSVQYYYMISMNYKQLTRDRYKKKMIKLNVQPFLKGVLYCGRRRRIEKSLKL